MRNIRRREVEYNYRIKRLVFLTFGILLFIYITINLIAGENGLLRYLKLRSVRDNLLAETIVIRNQNQEMKDQLESLQKNPNVIEELAREYGMTKKGELIFKFEDEE